MRRAAYLLSFVLSLLSLLVALLIFSSLVKFVPWYEPWGIQLLGLLYVCWPVLGVSLLVNMALRLFAELPLRDTFFPLLAALVLMAWFPACLLLRYTHPSTDFLHYFGAAYSVVCCLAITRLFKNLRAGWRLCRPPEKPRRTET